jgi:deazaflavin-dependent oxidoreductase (nitroreductase family)
VSRLRAAAGSALFFLVAPGTIVAVIPWLLTDWRLRDPLPGWMPLRVVGAVLLFAGVAAAGQSFVRFVIDGRGTPAPVAAPDRLVVGGLYGHVRNPMYVALLAAIGGESLLLGQVSLLAYAAVVGSIAYLFVRLYEEPELRRRFGDQYDAYRREVPGWWPRLRYWQPGTAPPDRPRRLPWWVPVFNRIARPLLAAGVPMGPDVLLTVRGRKTGVPRTTPVTICEDGGRRGLISPFGEVNWVRNLRVAGRATISAGRRREEVSAVELGPAEAAEFIRDVLAPHARRTRFGRWFVRHVDGIDFDDPVVAAAGRPVFELHAAPAPHRHAPDASGLSG